MAIYELMILLTREGMEVKTVSEANKVALTAGKTGVDSESQRVGTVKQELGKKYKLVKKR